MENIKFNAVKDYDIKKSIHELTAEVSKLKAEIFKTIVMGKELDRQAIKRFELYMNDFLRFWSDNADSLKAAIKNVKIDDCEEGLNVIEYEYVKRFIYGNYDYASILQFTDGVLKGIESGTMNKAMQIDDFKNHTIDMAFNKQDPTVAGLLDSVLSEGIESVQKKAEVLDLKNFDTIRNYDNLFSLRDRPELYKAITKLLEYITTQGIAPKGLDHDNVRLFISLVNNIGEYITYSLTVYAARIFIISKYAEPFIDCKHVEDEVVTESVDPKIPLMNVSEDPNGSASSIFHNTDELIIKDPKKFTELAARFDEFLKLTGAGSVFKDSDVSRCNFHMDEKIKKGNKLIDQLKNNVLYDFFTNNSWLQFNRDREINITEIKQRLSSMMYNNLNGIMGTNSPKAEFILIVQKAEYGKTLKDYQTLARDLTVVTVDLAYRISTVMNDNLWQLEDEMQGNYLKLGARKMVAETIRFLLEVYEEIVFVLVQKAAYIERKINELKADDMKKTISITTLNIPGMKSDIDMDNSMMLSAPDTTRIALSESVDLYAMPIFEASEMYDEYLRTRPDFTNDWYLKEIADDQASQGTSMKDKFVDNAGSVISTIINKLRAIVKALWDRLQSFYNSQSFSMAKKWILDNEETLKGLQFPADAKIEILPYKDDITLPKGFSNLQKNLINFDEKTVASPDALQKYLRTLYPNDQVAQWFASDTDGKVAAQKYMNLILFDEGSDQPKTPIVITGADIQKKMILWINTIKESDATRDGFKKINDDINNGIGAINSKIVNINNQNKASQQTPDAASTDASQAGNMDDPNKPQVAPEQNTAALVADASNRITAAISRLWSPLAPMIIRAMMNQYGYIKTAYSLGQASPQVHTPEGGQQQKGQL